MSELDYLTERSIQKPPLVDYKRVITLALQWWYLILLSLIIAIAIAFVTNRYSTRVYPVSMSVLIKEAEETGNTAELLYNNPLINSYRNYFNELYIIRSYSLIESVVRENGLDLGVYREGRVKTTEIYDNLPFTIRFMASDGSVSKNNSGSYSLYIEDKTHFSLESILRGDILKGESGVIYTFEDKKVVIELNDLSDSPIVENDRYLIIARDSYQLAKAFSGRLNVEWAEEGASVINLNINGSLVQQNIDFLNKLIEKYGELDLERKNEVASKSLEFIDAQLEHIKDSLRVFEGLVEVFKKDNLTVDLSAEAEQYFRSITSFEDEKAAYMVQEEYLNYLDEFISDKNIKTQIVIPTTVGITDPVLLRLIDRMVELQLAIESRDELINPFIEQQSKEFEILRLKIKESLVSLRKSNSININRLNKSIGLQKYKLRKIPASERALASIERNYRLNENMYVFLMQKRAEAGISMASSTSDIQIINEAYLSGGSITPNTRQNYISAVFIGLGIPLGIIVLIIILNQSVQSKSDIETLTKIPILGAVGHNNSGENIVVAKKPRFAISESFRSLRSNLNYFTQTNGNSGGKVYVVTSSISGEGKTFTTMNLATVFAYSGKKTLIIGGDMRRPRMFDDFGLVNNVGMSTVLSETIPWKETVQTTFIENLDFIAAGPVPPNPSELLMKSRTKEIVDSLKESYDFILIDSPPVVLVTDAFILSELADHTIYITRQNYTPKEALISINEYFVSGKIKNISIVFNDVANNRFGYG